jgi:non-ribosomal peptide synthetase component F
MYNLLLAAYVTLLHKYTHQEDIIVGSPMAGRSQLPMEDCVGYFVNPVPLRVSVAGNPSFKNFLARTRQVVMEALEHQDLPFPQLVERLQLQRDLSRTPVFQVLDCVC